MEELTGATQTIYDHFAHFGLQRHVGTRNKKSKTEAMFFTASLKEATILQNDFPTSFSLNNGVNNIQFMVAFKYLGSIITPCLTKDKEINTRIKKAKSQMGLLRHFFNCKDIDLNIKYWIYMAGPLNILLWGSES